LLENDITLLRTFWNKMMSVTENDNTGINQYLNGLDDKIKKSQQEALADTPRIGIFWICLKDKKIQVFHSIIETLEFSQNYGDFIVSAKEHSVIWDSLARHNITPKNSEYTDLPRGRIAYNTITKKYVAFHGKWITSEIKAIVKSEYKLKSNTQWEPDFHYHQFKRWGF